MSWKLAELRWRQDAGLRERSEKSLYLTEDAESNAVGVGGMETKNCSLVHVDSVAHRQLVDAQNIHLGSIRSKSSPHPPQQGQFPELSSASFKIYHPSYSSSAPLLALPRYHFASPGGSGSASSEFSAALTKSIGSSPSQGSAPQTPQEPVDFLNSRDWQHLNWDQKIDRNLAAAQLRTSLGLRNTSFPEHRNPIFIPQTTSFLETAQSFTQIELQTSASKPPPRDQQQTEDWSFSTSDLPDPVVPWSNLEAEKEGLEFLTKHFFKHEGVVFEVFNPHESFGHHSAVSPEDSVETYSCLCPSYHSSKSLLLPEPNMDSSKIFHKVKPPSTNKVPCIKCNDTPPAKVFDNLMSAKSTTIGQQCEEVSNTHTRRLADLPDSEEFLPMITLPPPALPIESWETSEVVQNQESLERGRSQICFDLEHVEPRSPGPFGPGPLGYTRSQWELLMANPSAPGGFYGTVNPELAAYHARTRGGDPDSLLECEPDASAVDVAVASEGLVVYTPTHARSQRIVPHIHLPTTPGGQNVLHIPKPTRSRAIDVLPSRAPDLPLPPVPENLQQLRFNQSEEAARLKTEFGAEPSETDILYRDVSSLFDNTDPEDVKGGWGLGRELGGIFSPVRAEASSNVPDVEPTPQTAGIQTAVSRKVEYLSDAEDSAETKDLGKAEESAEDDDFDEVHVTTLKRCPKVYRRLSDLSEGPNLFQQSFRRLQATLSRERGELTNPTLPFTKFDDLGGYDADCGGDEEDKKMKRSIGEGLEDDDSGWATDPSSDLKLGTGLKFKLPTQTTFVTHNTTHTSLADYSSNDHLSHQMSSPISSWDPLSKKYTMWHPGKPGTPMKYRKVVNKETGEKMMLPVHPSPGIAQDDSDPSFDLPFSSATPNVPALSFAAHKQSAGLRNTTSPIFPSPNRPHSRYPPSSYKGPNSLLVRDRSAKMEFPYSESAVKQGKLALELEGDNWKGMSTGISSNLIHAIDDSTPTRKGKSKGSASAMFAPEKLVPFNTRMIRGQDSGTASMYSQDDLSSPKSSQHGSVTQQIADPTQRFSMADNDGSYYSSSESLPPTDDAASVNSFMRMTNMGPVLRKKKNFSFEGIPRSTSRLGRGIRATGSSQADFSSSPYMSPYNPNNVSGHVYSRVDPSIGEVRVMPPDSSIYDRNNCPKFPLDPCYLGIVFGENDLKSPGISVATSEVLNGKIREDAYCFVHKRKEFNETPHLPDMKAIILANTRLAKNDPKVSMTPEDVVARALQMRVGRAIIFASLFMPVLGSVLLYKVWKGEQEADETIAGMTGKRVLWFGEEEAVLAGWVLVVQLGVVVSLVVLLVVGVVMGWW